MDYMFNYFNKMLQKSSKEYETELIDNLKEIQDLILRFNKSNGNIKSDVGKKLYQRLKDIGCISYSIDILKKLIELQPKKNSLYMELNISKEKLALLNDTSHKSPSPYIKNKYTIYNMDGYNKILHVLNTSMPYVNNGYSIRSDYIIKKQKEYGFKPVAVTRPGFPNDFFPNAILNSQKILLETFDDIHYYRPYLNEFMRCTPIKQYISHFSGAISYVVAKESPHIIHAASNYVIGLSALNAARGNNRPFVYEIRGFWELSKASKEPLFAFSEEFSLSQLIETYLSYEADIVVVICEHLKEELISRGVDENKIYIVPNGVDCNRFVPLEPDKLIKEKYNLYNCFVIGYIGSIVNYEGLQNLIEALRCLKKKGYSDIRLVIVGEGESRKNLEELSRELSLQDSIIFIGKIPHNQVVQFYSAFDICVYPRLKKKVTDMVTPLKPLEAMACGKAVVCSDVDAMKEIIIPEVNGLIFNNTIEDLCRKIQLLYLNKDFKISLGNKSRKWVESNRDWDNIVKIYEEIYRNIYEKSKG
ncbi:glycosyltransferase family 4 protein [Caloramator sp. E03]|uniref:glycosyltransferase family 4 protein n=1 Tax=Caloramator sp. E03 TaxID=2576307 RepID=UPI00143D3F40|nr:glycosyltransferase family 4 protein [Caloramator sp. E03]